MSAVLDEAPAVLADLEFPIPCARNDTHAADVIVQCRFCGLGAFYCRGCVDVMRVAAATALSEPLGQVIGCYGCDTRTRAFDDLVKVVPL